MTQHVRPTSLKDVREDEIVLSGEELEVFVKKTEALRKLLTDGKVKARYKLEILFGAARSNQNPTPGVLTFWHSGARLHGGGDDKIYLCPGSRLGRSDCAQPLFDYSNTGMSVICPSCGQVWEQAAVIGEIFFRLPMYKWAVVLHRYFHQFDCNCDIYLKHAPDDIRSVSLAQSAKATWEGSKKLARVRDKRARFVYPLHNILVDTSAGADLISRFRAFLTA